MGSMAQDAYDMGITTSLGGMPSDSFYRDYDSYSTKKKNNSKGHKINYGETYSYKFYGNEIFTSDQVSKVSTSTLSINHSKNGLAKKLLQNTGSKRMAKDILVNEYGLSQKEAKKAVGYNGY